MLREAENSGKSGKAPRYAPEERNAVARHIAGCFGPPERGFRFPGPAPLDLEVLLAPPRREGEGYLLCTLGLGAVVMAPPEGEEDASLRRAEVFLPLAPGWEPGGEGLGKLWPAAALLALGRRPLAKPDFWLGPGRIFHLPELAAQGLERCWLLLLPPREPWVAADPCFLPGGEPVWFLQALPLREQEARLTAKREPGDWEELLGGGDCRVSV